MSVVYTATVSGKTYGFDFDDQRIDVDATLNSMLVTDLYTAIKLAQASTEGISYPVIADGSGRNVLGAGVETYLTVTLKDNWEVLTLKATGKFEVFGGNLIRDDQGGWKSYRSTLPLLLLLLLLLLLIFPFVLYHYVVVNLDEEHLSNIQRHTKFGPLK